MVSMNTSHFEDVLRGCHRLLDLQHKYDDLHVLALLVRAVVDDMKDADGNGAARYNYYTVLSLIAMFLTKIIFGEVLTSHRISV